VLGDGRVLEIGHEGLALALDFEDPATAVAYDGTLWAVGNHDVVGVEDDTPIKYTREESGKYRRVTGPRLPVGDVAHFSDIVAVGDRLWLVRQGGAEKASEVVVLRVGP
jgi:hypothetical protein